MNATSRILVTGASGFVGRAVCAEAIIRGLNVRAATRVRRGFPSCAEEIVVGDISSNTDWGDALKDCHVVVHLAARVHVMNDESIDPITDFRRINVESTLALARQAARAGVRRFLFVSSVKVNGEQTEFGSAYHADDLPAPEDAYALSKAEAEAGLKLLAVETGMEVTIIRPPLVYGPGVKGNFSILLSWVARGMPLPLGAVKDNRRSWVGLDNLVDLILVCIEHPEAGNQIFLVSDGEDLSTAELLRKLGEALNRPAQLLQVPVRVLAFLASVLGKGAVAQRLLGSLRVDISKTCLLLNWKPSVSIDEGLRKAVRERV